MPVELNNY